MAFENAPRPAITPWAQYLAAGFTLANGNIAPLQVDANGKLLVTGDFSGTATAEGIGAIDDPVVTDPDVDSALTQSNKGALDLQAQILAALQDDFTALVIEANGSLPTPVVNGPGTFGGFFIGTVGTTANNLIVYDSLTASGTKLLPTINTVTTPLGMHPMRVRFGTGLSYTLATDTAAKIAIFYRAD